MELCGVQEETLHCYYVHDLGYWAKWFILKKLRYDHTFLVLGQR